MGCQLDPHPVGVSLPTTRRTLNIGEQKRHRPHRIRSKMVGSASLSESGFQYAEGYAEGVVLFAPARLSHRLNNCERPI